MFSRSLRVTPANQPAFDIPYVDLPSDRALARRVAVSELREGGLFVALIDDRQGQGWRSLAGAVARELQAPVITETSRTAGGRLAAMVTDSRAPDPADRYPWRVRSGAVLPDDLWSAVEVAGREQREAQTAAAREAAIAASPDVSVCTEEEHTHSCQRGCCVAACDLIRSQIDEYLSPEPNLDDGEDERGLTGWEREESNDVFGIWVHEALGRTDYWDPREHLLIYRDLLHSLPEPGSGDQAETGHFGVLSSLCREHQPDYPDLLVAQDTSQGLLGLIAYPDAEYRLRDLISAEL